MDKKIIELERVLKAEPDNLSALEAISYAYDRVGKKNEAIVSRILFRLHKNKITEKKIIAAAKLGYRPAQEVCNDYSESFSWDNRDRKELLKYYFSKDDAISLGRDLARRAINNCKDYYSEEEFSILNDCLNLVGKKFPRTEIDLAWNEAQRIANKGKYTLDRSITTNKSVKIYNATRAVSNIIFAEKEYRRVPDDKERIIISIAGVCLNFINSSNFSRHAAEIRWEKQRFAEYLIGEA